MQSNHLQWTIIIESLIRYGIVHNFPAAQHLIQTIIKKSTKHNLKYLIRVKSHNEIKVSAECKSIWTVNL